jgi:TATA-binding protein-associated factor Taf7
VGECEEEEEEEEEEEDEDEDEDEDDELSSSEHVVEMCVSASLLTFTSKLPLNFRRRSLSSAHCRST